MLFLQKRISQALDGSFSPISKSELKILMDEFFTLVEFEYAGVWDASLFFKAVFNEKSKLTQGALASPWLWTAYSLLRWLHTGTPVVTVTLSETGVTETSSMYESVAEQLGLKARTLSPSDKLEANLPSEPFYVTSYNSLVSHSIVMDLSPSSAGAYVRDVELFIPNGVPFVTGELPVVSIPVFQLESATEQTVLFASNVFRFIFGKLKSGDIEQSNGHFDVDQTNHRVSPTDKGVSFIRGLWDELTSKSKVEPGLYNLYFKFFISALEAAWLYEVHEDYTFRETGEVVWRSQERLQWVAEDEKPEYLNWAVKTKHGLKVKGVVRKQVSDVMNSYDVLSCCKHFCISLPYIDKTLVKSADVLKKCAVIKPLFPEGKPAFELRYVSGQRVHQSVLNEFLSDCKDKWCNATVIVRADAMKSVFKGLPNFVSVKTHYEVLDSPESFSGRALVFEYPNSKGTLDALYSKITKGQGVHAFNVALCSFDMRFSADSNEGLALDLAASNYTLASNPRAKKKSVKALVRFWQKYEAQLKERAFKALPVSGEIRAHVRNVINKVAMNKWGDLVAHEFTIRRLLGDKEDLILKAIDARRLVIEEGNQDLASSSLKNELLTIYYKQLALHYKSTEVSYLNAVLSGPDFSAPTQTEKRLRNQIAEFGELLC